MALGHKFTTSQLLWPLATTNYGAHRPQIVSLWTLNCCGPWPQRTMVCTTTHQIYDIKTSWPLVQHGWCFGVDNVSAWSVLWCNQSTGEVRPQIVSLTSQLLWPSATTNYDGRRQQIVPLRSLNAVAFVTPKNWSCRNIDYGDTSTMPYTNNAGPKGQLLFYWKTLYP